MLPSRIQVLWIEDEALYQLNELLGPVLYRHRQYHLDLAVNASEAQQKLCESNNNYDVIIVDMRIPPGEAPTWKDIYRKQGNDKNKARLGAYLIEWMLDQSNGWGQDLPRPQNKIPATQIAIFSAEEPKAIQNLLDYGIQVYQPKDSNYPDNILLEIIQRVQQIKHP